MPRIARIINYDDVGLSMMITHSHSPFHGHFTPVLLRRRAAFASPRVRKRRLLMPMIGFLSIHAPPRAAAFCFATMRAVAFSALLRLVSAIGMPRKDYLRH